MKEEIRKDLLKTGALAVGFSSASEIDPLVHKDFVDWIDKGFHGEMSYLKRHIPLRQTLDNVLPGAKTVISLAYGFSPHKRSDNNLPVISSYAYYEDYHLALHEKLNPIIKDFQSSYGGKWRLCIDSAPVAERFWALKSGIGRRGLNGCVIIDGWGSFVFLAEILTNMDLPPDISSLKECDKCRLCINLCPVKALTGDGKMDARKCINYLTIEKKTELTDEEERVIGSGPGYLLGCDLCMRVCPHNVTGSNKKEERGEVCYSEGSERDYRECEKDIIPKLEEINYLETDNLLSLGKNEFKQKFSRSPLYYVGLEKLKRNALIIKKEKKERS